MNKVSCPKNNSPINADITGKSEDTNEISNQDTTHSSPMAEMEEILTIIDTQLNKALPANNAKEIQSWLKLKILAVEKYHTMLRRVGGTSSAEQSLAEILLHTKDPWEDPPLYIPPE